MTTLTRRPRSAPPPRDCLQNWLAFHLLHWAALRAAADEADAVSHESMALFYMYDYTVCVSKAYSRSKHSYPTEQVAGGLAAAGAAGLDRIWAAAAARNGERPVLVVIQLASTRSKLGRLLFARRS